MTQLESLQCGFVCFLANCSFVVLLFLLFFIFLLLCVGIRRDPLVAGSDDHVTVNLNEYQFGSNVTLVDTWGYSDKNWGEFRDLLEGKLKDGFTKDSPLNPSLNPTVRKNASYQDKIHAVMFVMSAVEAVSDTSAAYVKRLKEFTTQCDRLGRTRDNKIHKENENKDRQRMREPVSTPCFNSISLSLAFIFVAASFSS